MYLFQKSKLYILPFMYWVVNKMFKDLNAPERDRKEEGKACLYAAVHF